MSCLQKITKLTQFSVPFLVKNTTTLMHHFSKSIYSYIVLPLDMLEFYVIIVFQQTVFRNLKKHIFLQFFKDFSLISPFFKARSQNFVNNVTPLIQEIWKNITHRNKAFTFGFLVVLLICRLDKNKISYNFFKKGLSCLINNAKTH